MRKAYQQLKEGLSYIDILKKHIVSGVLLLSSLCQEDNNDLANAFVLELLGSREMIPIPGTRLYIYDPVTHVSVSLILQ